jgi:choline monooxygenase
MTPERRTSREYLAPMNPDEFRVDPDVRTAATPPADLYRDRAWHDAVVERVLARGWHAVADAADVAAPESALPLTLLPGVLDEPLALVRDKDATLRALSNVCTHRGNLVVQERGPLKTLRCCYHGRKFRLDGQFASMPGFEDAPDFPRASDSLPRCAAATWGPLAFAAVSPSIDFDELLAPVRERLGWMDFASLSRDDAASKDYEIDANWLLYVDNYLEGFHVPFVHPELARTIDVAQYATELLPHGVLQTGIAAEGEPALEPPAGHADHGRRVAGLYWWLFPTTMLNVYPWGLSLNVVQPLGPSRTRVKFVSYVGRRDLRGRGAGGDLHRVEMQDEAVVEGVQRGLRSRLYRPGRYSAAHERGVHHFHRMLAVELARPAVRPSGD